MMSETTIMIYVHESLRELILVDYTCAVGVTVFTYTSLITHLIMDNVWCVQPLIIYIVH